MEDKMKTAVYYRFGTAEQLEDKAEAPQKRVWLYRRCASPQSAELSLAQQKAELELYCKQHGYKIVGDTEVCGSSKESIEKLLQTIDAAAEVVGTSAVLAAKPDRFARELDGLFLAKQKADGLDLQRETASADTDFMPNQLIRHLPAEPKLSPDELADIEAQETPCK
ncbi:MAG: recombinase family protein [Oscillospiraceae bacterium]|nr:recombinase family protein [Oscillospiraceae bacterium]